MVGWGGVGWWGEARKETEKDALVGTFESGADCHDGVCVRERLGFASVQKC